MRALTVFSSPVEVNAQVSPAGQRQGPPSWAFSLWDSHIDPKAPGPRGSHPSHQCTEARLGWCGLEEARDLVWAGVCIP